MAEKRISEPCCMIVSAPYLLGETRVQREAEILEIHGYKVDVIYLRLPGDLPLDNYKSVHIYRQRYRLPILGYRVLPAILDEFADYPLHQWCQDTLAYSEKDGILDFFQMRSGYLYNGRRLEAFL